MREVTATCKYCSNLFTYDISRGGVKIYCNRMCKDKYWFNINRQKAQARVRKYQSENKEKLAESRHKKVEQKRLARKEKREKLKKLFQNPKYPLPRIDRDAIA